MPQTKSKFFGGLERYDMLFSYFRAFNCRKKKNAKPQRKNKTPKTKRNAKLSRFNKNNLKITAHLFPSII